MFSLIKLFVFKYSYILIFRGFTYYKMTNLDNRIANADQLLTQDVEKFSNSVADLYSNLSKVSIWVQKAIQDKTRQDNRL